MSRDTEKERESWGRGEACREERRRREETEDAVAHRHFNFWMGRRQLAVPSLLLQVLP